MAVTGYVDAHVHVWTDDVATYPLASGCQLDQVKPERFMPHEVLAHANRSGVTRIVLVQMSYYGADNAYMLDVMAAHPGVFAGIGVVDWSTPEPDREMVALSRRGVRGFRIYPKDVPLDCWLDGEGFERMFVCAADNALAICPLIGVDALPALARMCERHPDTTVLIDHLCRIGAGQQPVTPAAVSDLCAMARFPRVMVKVSAFYALGQGPPHDDLAEPVRRVVVAFGAQRLMWGSDCPYQVARETYEAGIAPIRDRYGFLTDDDREWLLRRTAESVFFHSTQAKGRS